jgi:hypothetical protein
MVHYGLRETSCALQRVSAGYQTAARATRKASP